MRHYFTIAMLYLIFVLDVAGIVIAYIIFAPMLLKSGGGMSAMHSSPLGQNGWLALLLASYSLAQLVGAPIMGAVSDWYGRKKTLLVSTGIAHRFRAHCIGCLLATLLAAAR